MQAALFVALAFLLGSVPFGVLVARRRGVNIRQQGSGNIGATNVARVLGKAPAVIVLLLDAAKAAGPTYLALRVGQGSPVVAAVAFAAIAGHCFSPWLGFRGGKGVACAIGAYLVIAPLFSAIVIGVFALVVAITRVPALGSAAGVCAMAALLVAFRDTAYGALGVGAALLILYAHRSNWAQLRARRASAEAPPAMEPENTEEEAMKVKSDVRGGKTGSTGTGMEGEP